MKRLLWLAALFLSAIAPALAVDRSAFTTTSYQLDVTIDRTAHVIAVTGKVTLRNDSSAPQKNPVLQVSSSLAWNGIALKQAPVEWIGGEYTSDIDHTGALAEAIVTLPAPVAPGGSTTLDVQYGGMVQPDSTRFTRIGVPEKVALQSDWDQINPSFTALRGLGNVVWYPVSIPAVSLSDGAAVFAAIDEWQYRHRNSEFNADLHVVSDDVRLCIAGTGMTATCGSIAPATDPRTDEPTSQINNSLHLSPLGNVTPAFAVAEYERLERPEITVRYTGGNQGFAMDFAATAEANDKVLDEWLKPAGKSVTVIELTNPNANPYMDGTYLFTPMRSSEAETLGQLLIPVQVAARFTSPRRWINDGLQRFLQAVAVERLSGRKAAVLFLNEYLPAMIGASQGDISAGEKGSSLITTSDQVLLRGKGAFVFWMLRDMLGDEVLQKALAAYRPADDTNTAYFQGLLEEGRKRNLEWFFDDWVYRDRGLPEFKIEAVYARALLESPDQPVLMTVTVSNAGRVGAEVPVIVQTTKGERTIRILVPAQQKVSARSQIPGTPIKVTANDGSVPVASSSGSVYDVPPPAEQP